MGRRLAVSSLVAAMGFSTSVLGLGVGDIDTSSSLNEPLVARIPLMSVKDTDINNIKVSLASPEAYERAGVDRPFYLSRLNFSVKRDPSRGVYIEVTTNDGVREPFLDFLMQIQWPQGRLLREYTLLLDPPIYANEQNGGSVASGEADQAAADTSGRAGASTATNGVTVNASARASEPDASTYGPVSSSDTLWKIATRLKPSGVSANQMMLALLHANPDAFMQGNINRLMRGSMLRVPDQDEMNEIGAGAAAREVRRQMARWRQGSSSTTADSKPTPPAETATGAVATEDTGAADTASSRDADVGKAAAVGGRLKVVAPEDSKGQEATASLTDQDLPVSARSVDQLQGRMTVLEETNASLESENRDLKTQVESLKEELARLQSAVNVQVDESVAKMGADSRENDDSAGLPLASAGEAAKADASTDGALTESSNAVASDADRTANEGAGAANTADRPEPTEGEVGSPASADQPRSTTASRMTDESESSVDTVTRSREPSADDTASEDSATPSTPPAASPWLQRLTDLVRSNLQWIGAGAAALLALIMGLLMARRRRRSDDPYADELAAAVMVPSATAFTDEDTRAADAVASEDTRQPERAVDPADQAERHLAAGDPAQAQDVLDEALGEDPDNKRLRYKLLEVLAERGDRGGFEAEAQVLHTQVESEGDPLWQQTVALGRDVAPEHPLFSDEPEADSSNVASFPTGFRETTADDTQEDAFDLDFDAPDAPETDDSDRDPIDDVAFDLAYEFQDRRDPGETAWRVDDTATTDRTAGEPDGPGNGDEFDLDFDLPGTDHGARSPDDELAFDLDRNDRVAAVPDSPASSSADDEDEFADLDFELPDDLAGERADDTNRRDGDTADTDNGLDFGGVSFDQDEDDDLDALDEVTTKLDLARAYLDMGDADGARGLLEEVVEEGDGVQKQEAAELLKRTA